MKLEINAGRCNGCLICENFCSFTHEQAVWPARARIRVIAESDAGPFYPTVCRQCEDADCAAACSVEAITLDASTGIWVVDEELCIGCGECAEACQYGGIVFDDELGLPLKCDLCGGEPECAAMCPTEAIVLRR